MTSTEYQPLAPPGKKHRNWWIWISAGLAVAVVGLIIWQVNTQSDLDAEKEHSQELQAQIDEGKESGSAAAGSYQAAYKDLEQELGATQQDLAATQQDLEEAQRAVGDAEQQAADAQQRAQDADSATDKANAQADQAQAELKAAESTATITKNCANAFVAELTTVAQSPDPTAAAANAKAELQGILDDCKAALGGS